MGYVEAFRRCARQIRCTGCNCIATVESDLLFSLDPRAVLNTLGHMVRRRTHQPEARSTTPLSTGDAP